MNFSAGQRVIWRHEPRGGYGYVIPVPAIVVEQTARRVSILAEIASGGHKRVSVKPESLREDIRQAAQTG